MVFQGPAKILAKKDARLRVLFLRAAHMVDRRNASRTSWGFVLSARNGYPHWVNPEGGIDAFEVGLVRKMIRVQMARLQAANAVLYSEQASIGFRTAWASPSRKACRLGPEVEAEEGFGSRSGLQEFEGSR